MAIRNVDISPIGVDIVRDSKAASIRSNRSQTPPAQASDQNGSAPGTADAATKDVQDNPQVKQPAPQSLRFSVDKDTGKTVVSLINPDTGEVLRQVPNEAALEVAKELGKYEGMFVDLKV